MQEISEGKLSLRFPADWQVIKYDASQWHTARMRSRLKAMDLLLRNPNSEHYWIEIKDCFGFETDSRPRLSPINSQELTDTKAWLVDKGFDGQIKAERKKPFIVDEVEAKLRETLAALMIAQRENDTELEPFQLIANNVKPLTAILLLTWDAKDFKRLATRLRPKLERRLQPYGVTCFVVNNEDSLRKVGVDCHITRN